MNFINLRTVASFEIPDSFRGVLRISPNIVSGVEEDDPTVPLTTQNNTLALTDSEGNILPLTFKSKTCKTLLYNASEESTLINIAHLYNKLYINKSLHIKPTLFIDKAANDKQPPLIFIRDGNALGYPLESPDDKRYVNWDNKLGSDSMEQLFLDHPEVFATDTTTYSSEHIKVDGKIQYQYLKDSSGVYHKVPEINRRTYALGTCPGHTYLIESADENVHNLSGISSNKPAGRYTQLSFISLDTILWSNVEASVTGIYRSMSGRYNNLQPIANRTTGSIIANSKDNLYNSLFGNIATSTIEKAAPIIGTPIQSGTIHYNAIPAHNYFFHLARRDAKYTKVSNANLGANGTMNNLFAEYVLCDGKTICNKADGTSDYPNIDTTSLIAGWDKMPYDSIITSMGSGTGVLKSPPLFELDQLSPRYLRGLNWLRNTAATAVLNTKGSTSTAAPIFSDNSKIYKPTNDAATTDVSNHKKNFKEVGVYYANYDTNIHRRYKHVHLLFANDSDSGPSLSTATASNDLKNMVQGKLSSNTLASYDDYVKNTDSRATYDGAKLMRTTNGTNNNISFASLSNKASIRLLQDWPISSNGGSTKYFHRNKSGHKTARVKLGKCFGHYDCSGTIHNIRDTRYSFASAESGKSWRFITSLPIQNKYGQKEGTVPKLATARYGSITINIDDSLPNPPTINFIPLFKI